MSEAISLRTQYSTSPTLVDSSALIQRASSPNSIIKDLQRRVVNWAGVDLSSLGRLIYHDSLTMRKGPKEKDFQVYLFEEAMICLADQKRNVFQSFGLCPSSRSMPPLLRLKGRIFLKHITRIQDTSGADGLSLTIEVDSRTIDGFTIVFKDEWNLRRWHSKLSRLSPHSDASNSKSSKPSKPIS